MKLFNIHRVVMDEEKLFYNLVIDLDVESQDQIFDLGSTGEPRKNLPFCASSEGPRWTLNNNTK